MQLPHDFEEYTKDLMGKKLYATLLQGLNDTPTISIRINPFKDGLNRIASRKDDGIIKVNELTPVPWCSDGFYLARKPEFIFDPLLHAGTYYVQEASSMFLDYVLRQVVKEPIAMLDLSAAPGGKTTCAMGALPKGSILCSNEPVKKRASILRENVEKYGHPDIIVTNNYAKDYAKARMAFDVILTDVPCSGEGMFRKNAFAIEDWSTAKVSECQRLQRSIVEDIWQCLKPGGILVYSTCTFNAMEDEENVEWVAKELGAKPIQIKNIAPEWNITGALKGDFPVYRFIPGVSRGEGLFMAVLQKDGEHTAEANPRESRQFKDISKKLHVLTHGVNPPEKKGKKIIPDESLSLTINQEENNYPRIEVDYNTAIKYLRREAITLPPDTPRGIVTICFGGLGLGFANNLSNRANNLFPQEWRIKTTH